jgi:hypothetical protein
MPATPPTQADWRPVQAFGDARLIEQIAEVR